MGFTAPGNHASDTDGFAPPTFGGAIATKYDTVTFEDTVSRTIFTLPQGAVLTKIVANVTVANDDSTTAVLDVGTAADPDAYVDAINAKTLGYLASGDALIIDTGLYGAPLAEDTAVNALITAGTGDAAAGTISVAIEYMLASS